MEGRPERRHHRKKSRGSVKAKGGHHRMGLETGVGNERGTREGGQHGVCLEGGLSLDRFAARTGFRGKLSSSKGLDVVKCSGSE